jgi:hypothetical protein
MKHSTFALLVPLALCCMAPSGNGCLTTEDPILSPDASACSTCGAGPTNPDAGQHAGSVASSTTDSGSGPCAALAGPHPSGTGATGGPDGQAPSVPIPDAAINAPCGPGGQCVEGPYCTPGGCVGANEWTCVYTSDGPCQAVAGRLICGDDSALDGGTSE